MTVNKKVKEVRLIGEDGECLTVLTPEEYFFGVKLKWYQKVWILARMKFYETFMPERLIDYR